MIRQLLQHLRLKWLIHQGLQVQEDCQFADLPAFGSEPYLITIGHHVKVEARVTFITHDGGTWVFRENDPYKDVVRYGRIVIHDNCFIGKGSILMPGITIGPGSVVAPGSLVTRDVPPGMVAAGLPARPVETVEAYAERLLAETTPLAPRNPDRKTELLRLFPRPW